MSKFNQRIAAPASALSPLSARSATPNTSTYEGAPAYTRDPRAELFLLGVSNFVGENTFYEKADDRDNRYATLARTVAVQDGPWFASYVRWLRSEGNMRSAALVAVAEGVKARLDAKTEGDGVTNRSLVSSVLQRADEPGEFLAYWQSHFGDGAKAKLAMSVKRGIADAIEGVPTNHTTALYTPYSAFKYDTPSHAKRFGDVIELVHPQSSTHYREQLYHWLLDRRHGRADGEYPLVTMLAARKTLEEIPQDARATYLTTARTDELQHIMKQAGVTWEWFSSWYGTELDASFWETVIPSMGYMALLRNLRNFDQAGVNEDVAAMVAMKLDNKDEVLKSRQLPFRFYSAYMASKESLRWGPALSGALQKALFNVPALSGRTLVLADTSGSMGATVSDRSTITWALQAGLFGSALSVAAARGEGSVDLYGFGNLRPFHHLVRPGDAVLSTTARFAARIGEAGHGTETGAAVQQTYSGHDRVIILTDEQTFGQQRWYGGDVSSIVPSKIPVYSFNLIGYQGAMLPDKPKRYQLGGLTDDTFRMIPLLEAGERAEWPWSAAS